MTKPASKINPLVIGDRVAVVAPGFGSSAENLIRGVEFLRTKGFVVETPRNILQGHFLHSHTDDFRFAQLKQAFENPEVSAVWCLRGGYGSQRLLPRLAKIRRPKTPKWLIGMSDISALNAFLWQEWGWPSLHGPVLERLSLGQNLVPVHAKETWEILTGSPVLRPQRLRPMNSAARSLKALRGVALGGNLVTYASLIGTPFLPNSQRQILFFEEVGERGYRIDRLLTQLQQCSEFKNVKSVIFGTFSGGLEPGTERSLLGPVLQRFAEEVKIPVFTGFPFGHTHRQKPWIFGGRVSVKRSQKDRFEVDISL